MEGGHKRRGLPLESEGMQHQNGGGFPLESRGSIKEGVYRLWLDSKTEGQSPLGLKRLQ